MKYYVRLAIATLAGVALIGLLAGAVYWARSAFAAAGHAISDRVFIVVLFGALGGGFGFASKFILRLIKSHEDSKAQRAR